MAEVREVSAQSNEQIPYSNEKSKEPIIIVDDSSDPSLKGGKKNTWRPGFWHQFPYMGIGALIGVIICSVCNLVVIYASNGRSESQWPQKIAPNVILSVLNSVASILITMAVGQGIAIAWWRKALHGATVEELHNSWSFSSSISTILKKYRFFNTMALAALCTKFAIVDSTLYQKATYTTTELGPKHYDQTWVFPTEQFPVTGQLDSAGNSTAVMSYETTFSSSYWLQASAGVSTQDLNGFQLCEGLCQLTYRGIGFESTCTFTNSSVSRLPSASTGGNDVLLGIAFNQLWPDNTKNYSRIGASFTWWDSDSNYQPTNPQCTGQLNQLTCELRPAVIDYPVVIQNSSHSYRKLKTEWDDLEVFIGILNTDFGYYNGSPVFRNDAVTDNQLSNVTVVSYIDVPDTQTPNGNTTIGGINLALSTYFDATSDVTYGNSNSSSKTWSLTNTTGIYAQFAQEQDFHDGCPVGYTVDYENILNQVNLLTMIISDNIFLRPNYTDTTYNNTDNFYDTYYLDTERAVDTLYMKSEQYYNSRFGYAWGAFASTIVVVILVIPVYYGFWELGRKVSMGPFEIANAFQAPAFSHVATGAGHVDGVIEAVGNTRVQYGQIMHEQYGPSYRFNPLNHA